MKHNRLQQNNIDSEHQSTPEELNLFDRRLQDYRFLKGLGLPGVVFKPDRMGDSYFDSAPFPDENTRVDTGTDTSSK
jgi:hypothetical protein